MEKAHGAAREVAVAMALIAAGALDLEKVLVFFINANVSARLIVGLSKCGMHGEEPVRLKRLKRPWVDQD